MRGFVLVLLLSSAFSFTSAFQLSLSPGRAPVRPLLRSSSRGSPPLSCAPAELPSKALLGAIAKLGGRVTASDVAAETGTSITETQRQLLVLARLVGAELVVADDGLLSFVFEDEAALRRGLRSATWRMRGREAWDTVSPALAWTARAPSHPNPSLSLTLPLSLPLPLPLPLPLTPTPTPEPEQARASFGLGLLTSITIVVCALAVLSSKGDDLS